MHKRNDDDGNLRNITKNAKNLKILWSTDEMKIHIVNSAASLFLVQLHCHKKKSNLEQQTKTQSNKFLSLQKKEKMEKQEKKLIKS